MKSPQNVSALVRQRLLNRSKADNLSFNELLQSYAMERITEDADYEGVRVRFRGALGTARIGMQIDIGFGDIVCPGLKKQNFPACWIPRHHRYFATAGKASLPRNLRQ